MGCASCGRPEEENVAGGGAGGTYLKDELWRRRFGSGEGLRRRRDVDDGSLRRRRGSAILGLYSRCQGTICWKIAVRLTLLNLRGLLMLKLPRQRSSTCSQITQTKAMNVDRHSSLCLPCRPPKCHATLPLITRMQTTSAVPRFMSPIAYGYVGVARAWSKYTDSIPPHTTHRRTPHPIACRSQLSYTPFSCGLHHVLEVRVRHHHVPRDAAQPRRSE